MSVDGRETYYPNLQKMRKSRVEYCLDCDDLDFYSPSDHGVVVRDYNGFMRQQPEVCFEADRESPEGARREDLKAFESWSQKVSDSQNHELPALPKISGSNLQKRLKSRERRNKIEHKLRIITVAAGLTLIASSLLFFMGVSNDFLRALTSVSMLFVGGRLIYSLISASLMPDDELFADAQSKVDQVEEYYQKLREKEKAKRMLKRSREHARWWTHEWDS